MILRGQVINKEGAYFTSGQVYEFIQLVREVAGPGTLTTGSYDFAFQFKNVDLTTETYQGISLSVVYSVSAEMIYSGSMMKYTVKDSQVFTV